MPDTCYRQVIAMAKVIRGCCRLSIHIKLMLKFNPHGEVFRGGAGGTGEVVDLSLGPQHPRKKLGVAVCSYNPSMGVGRQNGRSPGVCGQSV